MSNYLRDETLKNLSLDLDKLKKIDDCLKQIGEKINYPLQEGVNNLYHLVYIIRFDNKGFRLIKLEDVVKYLSDAKEIERVVIYLDSENSIKANQKMGNYLNLAFDVNQPNNCYISVSGDTDDWVDSTFLRLKEIINRFSNKNYYIRNKVVIFLVQIFGVLSGLFMSLYGANILSPLLKIENSFAFSFVIIFLLFSNIWTYLYQLIINFGDYLWPNISLKNRGAIHWVLQAIIGTFIASVSVVLVNKLLNQVISSIKTIIK